MVKVEPEAPHDRPDWTKNPSSESHRLFAIVYGELFRPSLRCTHQIDSFFE